MQNCGTYCCAISKMVSAVWQWFSSFLLKIDILWCSSLCVLTQPAFVSTSCYIYWFWFILLLYLWILETQRSPLGSWAGLWLLKLLQSRCSAYLSSVPSLAAVAHLSDDSLRQNEHRKSNECVIFSPCLTAAKLFIESLLCIGNASLYSGFVNGWQRHCSQHGYYWQPGYHPK